MSATTTLLTLAGITAGIAIAAVPLRTFQRARIPSPLPPAAPDNPSARRGDWSSCAPWWLISAGAFCFTIGVLLRLHLMGPSTHSTLAWVAGGLSLSAYLMWLAAVVALRMHRNQDRSSLLDWLIACLGVGLVIFVGLHHLLPAGVGTRPFPQAMSGLYPYADLVFGLFILSAARGVHRRSLSMWLFVVAVGMLLLGNLSMIQAEIAGAPLLQLPSTSWPGSLNTAIGQACLSLGLAALVAILAAVHPSVGVISQCPSSMSEHAWNARRLAGLVPCLLSPFVALGLEGTHQSPVVIAAISMAGIAMIFTLLLRASHSARVSARAELLFRHQARHDALTGLANRRLLEEHITRLLPSGKEEAESAHTVWLLFLDLDGFKAVNDSWGHDVGDELLVDVAARLHLCLEEASIISRIGGDEFVVAVRGDEHAGPRMARRLLDVFTTPFRLSTGQVTISPSIGVARGNRHSSAQELIREADAAMYRAKAQGRSRWVLFDPHMREEDLRREDLDQALRSAIASGHLRVEYQPIVQLCPAAHGLTPSARVVGVEAFVRWHHPVLGEISPQRFLPIAEASGVSVELGRWTLTTALTHLASWHAAEMVEPNFHVCVNLSTRQLCDPQLPAAVVEVLQRTGVRPQCLRVEITEATAAGHRSQVSEVLAALHETGVYLSVDHFGAGNASLGYLQHYPISQVKIDPEVLSRQSGVRQPDQMVRGLVALCTQLNIEVSVTGVETQDYENFVRRLGITQAQGWRYVADFSALGHRLPARMPRQVSVEQALHDDHTGAHASA